MANPHALPLPDPFVGVIEGIRKLDDQGLIYELDYNQNYYELENFVNMLVKPGCSTFVTANMKKEAIMGRNYDFSHYPYNDPEKGLTGLAVVMYGNNPAAEYRSIGIADGYWMDQHHGSMFAGTLDDGTSDISGLALTPFICMDAMNDQGLAVSIMYLDTENRWTEVSFEEYEALPEETKNKAIVLEQSGEVPAAFDYRGTDGGYAANTADHRAWKNSKVKGTCQTEEGKRTVFHTVLMRMMMDYCSSTEEAIRLAQSVNVKSAMTYADFHILVTDRTGKSFVLEWTDNTLHIVPRTHATNYYVSSEGNPGHGKERDALLEAALNKYNHGMPERAAEDLLSLVSQDRRDGSDVGFTQWSSIYNLQQLTMSVYMQMDYSKAYRFKL